MSRASRTAPLLVAFALVAALAGCSSTGSRNTANPPDTTADSGLSDPDTTTETLPETTDTTRPKN